MVRILCLPGYLQSGTVFAEKSSGIRKLLTKKLNCQLDYVDPPFVISSKEDLPFQLSADPQEAAQKWDAIVAANCNRCWWQHEAPDKYVGVDAAFEFVAKYIQDHGPYDGVLGFSQGAAMAAMVSNSITKLVPSHGALAIAVMVSPFAFTDALTGTMSDLNNSIADVEEYAQNVRLQPKYADFFVPESSTKHVAVYGSEDAVVPPVRTKYLCSLYPQITEIVHDGGHYMPNKKPFLKELSEHFKEVFEAKL